MPENTEVTTLRPATAAPDTVQVTFAGDALTILEELRLRYELGTRTDVVTKAVEVLIGAAGREVLYRDRAGQIEVVQL